MNSLDASITHDEIGLAYGRFQDLILRSAYQPAYRLRDDHLAIIAARAFVRPTFERRALAPARLFDRLESVDRARLEDLCRSLHVVNLPYLDFGTRTLALNIDAIGASQLEADLANLREASDALEADGFDPPRIHCELSNTDPDGMVAAAALIRNRGFQVAIRDFGSTGIAPALAANPDYVRLHGAWFRSVAQLPDAVALLARLVELMHERGVEILADGIETKGEFEAALQVGADIFQGFYFAPPVLAGCAFHQRPLRLPERLRSKCKIIPLRRPA